MSRSKKNYFSVLIPDGEADLSFKVLTCLAQMPNVRVHVLSSKKNPRSRFSRFCQSFHFRDRGTEEEWLQHINRVVRETGADVVLPVFETGTRFACVWRERLAQSAALPPLPSTGSFDLAADKGLFAEFLAKHELPHPRTVRLSVALDRSVDGFPVLIKPRRSNDGAGIRLCESRRVLEGFAASHADTLDEYIVQEFAEGGDASCSVLCRKGEILAYTIHRPIVLHARQFAASLCIKHVECDQTLATVKKLMSVLDWGGVANIDFRYNKRTQQREILEINPRFSGNVVGSLTAGVNLPHLACLSAMNAELPQTRYRLQNYMEVRDAIKMALRKLKGGGGIFPNLARETNLPFILRDPMPFLNRSIDRHEKSAEKRGVGAVLCAGFLSSLAPLD
ncbi:MAG: ATP-grasp domain-containing protein [Burkholderiales bacterium]